MKDLAFRFELDLRTVLEDRTVTAHVRPEKQGRGWYVSFYYDCYRYYARRCIPGTLCFARKTRDYQYTMGGATRATQVRLDKVSRNKRNSHAKSLY